MYLNIPSQVDDNSWLILGSANPNFSSPVTASGTDWYAWTKPPQASMIFILAVGGGGLGRSGNSGANTVTRTGGIGGGTGGISSLLIDSALLPDTLFICVGRGAVSDAAGGDPGDTAVALRPSLNPSDLILFAGSGSATTSAGAAASTSADTRFNVYGNYNLVAGDSGSASTGTNGTTLTPVGTFLTGGGGGGNVSGVGASVNGVSIAGTGHLPSFAGGLGNSTVGGTGGDGNGGFYSIYPLLFSGGSGGGGASSGTGGRGGPAAPGCGGGGGGAGVTGGPISPGGSGFVFLKCI